MIKWIGQHIWDFISRFRNDVYLESLADPGSDTDKFLVIDDNDKVGYRTGTQVLNDIGGSGGGATTFVLEDDSGDEVTISHGKEVKFIGAGGLTVDWTDVSPGSDADPYDLTFTIGTLNQSTTGNAATATALATARGLQVDLTETDSSNFDGSANVLDIGVTGALAVGNGGTGTHTHTSTGVLIGSGSSTIQSYSNFTYADTNGHLKVISTDTAEPVFELQNYTDDATCPEIKFRKLRNNNMTDLQDGDNIGKFSFWGYDDGTPSTQQYAEIFSEIIDSASGGARGRLEFKVAEYDGTLTTGLKVDGAAADGEVDVTIGAGVGSTTTVAGNLNANGEDHMFSSGTNAKPAITLRSGGTSQVGANLTFQRSATGADNTNIGDIYFIGKNEADEDINYAHIVVDTADATDGAEEGQMLLKVASHDGELQPGLNIISGNVEDEVDATIGNGANSLVTVPGKLSIGTRIDFDSTGITAIQTAAELSSPGFQDNDTSLLTAAAIDDRINAAGGGGADGWHGSTSRIKLLHRDFIADDSGRPLLMDDTGAASENFFLESNASAPMYATVAIPTGFKATHVMVYGSATDAVEVWEHQINSKTGVSKGTGNVDTEFAITNVTSSTTNYLLIQVANASGNEVHGGYVTIAAV